MSGGWGCNPDCSLQRNHWDSWKPNEIDGKARNPEWKTSRRNLRGKTISLWAEGARIWNHCKRTARFKEGLWARLEMERNGLHAIHNKGEGNSGGPRGKGQRPSLWDLRASTYPCTYAMRNGGEEKHARARWCITKILNLNLTLSGCQQCFIK